MEENKVIVSDSWEFLKQFKDCSFDIIHSDPPYALGSKVIVREDGKMDYAKASDFMNKWDMPDGSYWEKWFKEAFRTVKHGGYLLMFGMDRQLALFKYYACMAGFEENQSVYWYFISNFPKATDLSKAIDKNAGAEREISSVKKRLGNAINTNILGNERPWMQKQVEQYGSLVDIETKPSTTLAKKYDGYKYSVSPLKQTCETIMVFKKPNKTGSPLHDVLALENGDDTIACSALDIDGNRVAGLKPSSATMSNFAQIGQENKKVGSGGGRMGFNFHDEKIERLDYENKDGRYPAQTFINGEVAKVLDGQSGNISSSKTQSIYAGSSGLYEMGIDTKKEKLENCITNGFGDIGGCSKILHKCEYEEADYDLFIYEPKVNKDERNDGCETFEDGQYSHDGQDKEIENPYQRNKSLAKNIHPTVKPIELNCKILKLFKSPNDQVICYPFAGSGSEVIGGIKAGFKKWYGCEINPEYVEIANARIEHWHKYYEFKKADNSVSTKEKGIEQLSLFDIPL